MTFRQRLQQRAKKSQATSALQKFTPYDIILWPMLTEKAHSEQESLNKYVFKVHKDANKNDVKKAIMYIYKVEPEKINISNVKYKKRQQRGLVRKAYKKAVITLWKKDKIDLWV